MPNYKKMYLSLFNDVTDAIEHLKQAQIKAEEIYISSNDAQLTALPDSQQSETTTE